MIRLTVILDGRKLVHDLSPPQVLRAAKALRECRPELERRALVILAEGEDRVTHIICNRPALYPMEN